MLGLRGDLGGDGRDVSKPCLWGFKLASPVTGIKVVGIKQQVLYRGDSLADWAESTGWLVPPLLPGSTTCCHCPFQFCGLRLDARCGSPSPAPLPSPRSLFTEAQRPPPPHRP